MIITILLQREELQANNQQLKEQAVQLHRQVNVMRSAAVLSSLPHLLDDSIAKLTVLNEELGGYAATASIDELESDLQKRKASIRPIESMIGLQVHNPNRTAEADARIQQMQSGIRPAQEIINELEWFIGLKKDLYKHYGSLAGIDPDAPWDDRWDN